MSPPSISTLEPQDALKDPDAVSSAANEIKSRVEAIYSARHKPIVIDAHSMGGPEALLTILRYPDLIYDGKIDKLIISQGSMCGSLADSPELVPSLIPENLTAVYRKSLAAYTTQPDLAKRLASHVYYIEAALDPPPAVGARIPLPPAPTSPSDGVIPLAWQTPGECLGRDFGRSLGVLKGQHCSFFCGGDPAEVSAYFKALAHTLFGRAAEIGERQNKSTRGKAPPEKESI